MLRIGITGGSGCGKTTLLRRISSRGGEVVDCDALYYALLRTDDALRAALCAAFGAVFLPDGTLDRKRLAETVFSDAEALHTLNTIVFSHVGRAVAARCAQAEERGSALFAVDAINLIESGLDRLCDVTVAVLAPEDVRLGRIMARDGVDEAYAKKRIRAQKSDTFYRENCRYILENGEISQAEFSIYADQLIDRIIKENES